MTVLSQHVQGSTRPAQGDGGIEACASRIDDWLSRLRSKWSTVPASMDRVQTNDLLKMSDAELLKYWRRERDAASSGSAYPIRGWYHELYRDVLRGKRVLDVGAGLGIDAFTFARAGAHMTLLDIVPTNVELHRRLAKALDVEVDHFWLHELEDLQRLPDEFDVIWAQGSMINAPFELMREESRALMEHLRVGGRWIELAYPKKRWEREGQLPFEKWGEKTDGTGTPWVEWYDLEKLLDRLAPARFETVLALNFHHDDFNWFDLARIA